VETLIKNTATPSLRNPYRNLKSENTQDYLGFRDDVSIMMECAPEIFNCRSVCTLWSGSSTYVLYIIHIKLTSLFMFVQHVVQHLCSAEILSSSSKFYSAINADD
jgi:hypothetical protein